MYHHVKTSVVWTISFGSMIKSFASAGKTEKVAFRGWLVLLICKLGPGVRRLTIFG